MTMRKQHEFSAEEVAAAQAEFPGLSEAEARISLERRQVYGDPYQNHYGIAQSWAGLLQVWAPRIARGEPIPPHVVALMMAALKTNRCRLQFGLDTGDLIRGLVAFAERQGVDPVGQLSRPRHEPEQERVPRFVGQVLAARERAQHRLGEAVERDMAGQETLTVRHCPGHTPGHVVFYSPEIKRAFVGDVLFAGSIGRTDFPRGNHQDLIDSITQRLWPMGDDTVFIPGHGPESTFGRERVSNPYVGGT